jgi:hypothetical protein
LCFRDLKIYQENTCIQRKTIVTIIKLKHDVLK